RACGTRSRGIRSRRPPVCGRIPPGSKGATGSAGRVQLAFIVFSSTTHDLRAACLRTTGICMEDPVTSTLPARPNLDHLRHQAKTLLADLKAGKAAAARAFAEHLPEARGMRPDVVRAAGFKLADAQSVIARRSGFASWAALSRHVEDLRALEGEWR